VVLLVTFRVSAVVLDPVPRADSCAILAEFKERGVRFDLGYRPRSVDEF
jgi:hypothetical protein